MCGLKEREKKKRNHCVLQNRPRLIGPLGQAQALTKEKPTYQVMASEQFMSINDLIRKKKKRALFSFICAHSHLFFRSVLFFFFFSSFLSYFSFLCVCVCVCMCVCVFSWLTRKHH